MVDFALLTDWVGAAALLTVLATGYGMVSRFVRDERITQTLAGLVFGLVAILHMNMPLTVADGVIFDMRNVPVVLAAAFLNVRGALITLLIAVATRIHIGGTGTEAGVAAMLVCAIMGFVWKQRTERKQYRVLGDYLRLALKSALSLGTIALLPTAAAASAATSAVPVLIALYLVFIPLTAYLLDREQTMLRLETMQRGRGGIDLDTGLLTRAAFDRELDVMRAAGDVGGVARIRVRHFPHLTRLWGTDKTSEALGALRARLRGVLSHAYTVGRCGEDTLAVPLTCAECARWDSLRPAIEAALIDRTLDFGDAGTMRLRLELELEPLPEARPDKADGLGGATVIGPSA